MSFLRSQNRKLAVKGTLCASIVMLAFFFVGCEKEPALPNIKTCYPVAISLSGDWDEVLISYDSNKRVTHLTIDGNAAGPFVLNDKGQLISHGSATYSYNASNQLTEILVEDGGTDHLTLTLSYAYNTSGQLISETRKEERLSTPPVSYTIYYHYPNSSTHNFHLIEVGNGALIHFRYDDKKNPLRLLGVFGRFFNPIEIDYFSLYFTDNNIVEVRVVEHNYESTVNFTYTYNQYGYPATVTRGGQIEREYTYDCL